MRKVNNFTLKKTMATGGLWAGISIVIDLVGWVLIKHPWSLTFKQFYVEYQPWITLVYLAIFLAPVIGFLCKQKWDASKEASHLSGVIS